MLINGATVDEINPCLEMFEESMRTRCADEQQFSRDMFKNHSDDPNWDAVAKFEDVCIYRILDEVHKLVNANGTANGTNGTA